MAVPIPNPADTQLSTAALRYYFFYSISFFFSFAITSPLAASYYF